MLDIIRVDHRNEVYLFYTKTVLRPLQNNTVLAIDQWISENDAEGSVIYNGWSMSYKCLVLFLLTFGHCVNICEYEDKRND